MHKALTLICYTLLCSVLTYVPASSAAELPAVEDFRVVAQEAKQKNVPILVLFMSNGCPYCEVALHDYLVPIYLDPAYDDKVILRQIALDQYDKLINFKGQVTTPHKFAQASNIFAVPTAVLFDSEGHELSRVVGLIIVDFYLAYVDNAINEALAKIRSAPNKAGIKQ